MLDAKLIKSQVRERTSLHHLTAGLRQTKAMLCLPGSWPSFTILYFWFCAVSLLNKPDIRPSYTVLPQLLLQKLLSWTHQLPVSDSSVWIQSSGLSPIEFAFFCVLFLHCTEQRGKRKRGEHFPFSFERSSGPTSSKESSRVSFQWWSCEWRSWHFCN